MNTKIDRPNPDSDKKKNPSCESSSQIRKPGLRKPKQKKTSYECSSQIRKPGLRKPNFLPKQKNLSYERSSQIRFGAPGSPKPWRIRMSLRAMKSVHEPVVVGLAGMVQEQPATRLAGMDPSEICINMQRIHSYM